jgi:hypothetical protein
MTAADDLLAGEPTDPTLSCPACRQRAPVDAPVCPHCGFPFSCDLTPISGLAYSARLALWRSLLGLGAIVFLLTSGLFYHTGYEEFYGYTGSVVATLEPALDSGIALSGPQIFIERSELALGLLRKRAPDAYWRMQDQVTTIEYLSAAYLETPAGRKITLEGIGALAEPATGRIRVIAATAFPSGVAELYDRDVYIYAGVLIHELRHIELHNMDLAPGGWQEEVLCETAAYNVLKQMEAPQAVLLRYEIYLENPLHRRYRKWYEWYEQW